MSAAACPSTASETPSDSQLRSLEKPDHGSSSSVEGGSNDGEVIVVEDPPSTIPEHFEDAQMTEHLEWALEASKHFYQELPKIFARRIEEDQRLLHGLESP